MTGIVVHDVVLGLRGMFGPAGLGLWGVVSLGFPGFCVAIARFGRFPELGWS